MDQQRSTELHQFCRRAGQGVLVGLHQKLKLRPNIDYYPRGNNSARVFSLRLAGVNPVHLPKIRSMRDQLTMWAGLDDRNRVLIGWTQYGITIEIPKPRDLCQTVTIEQLTGRGYLRRGAIATLGLGLQDEPRRINFQEAATAHVLIAGTTRSGKTNTQRLIAWNLAHNAAPDAVRFLLFDVAKKGYHWHDFERLNHLAHPLVTEIAEAERVLAWTGQELERRGHERRVTPRIFVIVDELKALIDESSVAASYLARLAAVGGEFGLHLVAATQYPQIKMLGAEGSELKRNISIRLCGRVDDAGAAVNTLGLKDSGAEYLQGYGDFLLRDLDGLCRLTVARLEPAHVAQLPTTPTVTPLDLPDNDTVYQGGRDDPHRVEPYPAEQVALALFRPELSINKLARRLGIGNSKATGLKAYTAAIRAWGLANGFRRIELATHSQLTPPLIRQITTTSGSNGVVATNGKG